MTEVQKRMLSMKEFCQAYGCGMTKAFAEIKSGRLKTVQLGRKRLVPVDAAEAWVRELSGEEKA